VSKLLNAIYDLIVQFFRLRMRVEALEGTVGPMEQEVAQLASQVKELHDELHPKDLRAVRWHAGPPTEEE